MQSVQIADFLTNCGMKVVRTASCWWYNPYWQERIYQAFPLHRSIDPSPQEIKELFQRLPKAAALRFLSTTDRRGRENFLWTRRRPYKIDCLSPNSRSKVRRGLKRCQVRKISWGELGENCWEADRDTAARHGDLTPSSLGLATELQECPAYEAWGAFAEGRLVAYAITECIDDWLEIIVERSVTDYLKCYSNNALIFTVMEESLKRDEISTISYGLGGLVRRESLDDFKLSMGFEKTLVRQRVILRPILKPLFSSPICWMVEKIAGLPKLKRNNRLQKIAGFCRVIRAS